MKFKMGAAEIKAARKQPGGSNVGKKTFASGKPRTGPYAGPSGGSPKGSYPIPDKAHAKAAIKMSGHAPNPAGIKSAVYRKYPDLKPEDKKQDGSKNVKSFPDLNKDGKVSKADVLVGRGVIPAKKMQMGTKGTKATPDSTAYYTNLTKKKFAAAAEIMNSPFGGRPLREQLKERSEKEKKFYNEAFQSIDNTLRQSHKGKPGYDANGFPIDKKKAGTKSAMMCGSKGMKYAEGTKGIKFKKKEMIKRADGSVSQRGLWDNIRANKGSGKKPTAEMLKQEKKIKFGK